MKNFLKGIAQFVVGIALVCVVALMAASYFNVEIEYAGAGVLVLAVVQTIAAPFMGISFAAGLLTELWTGDLIKKFRHEGSFLARIPSKNEAVNHDGLHMADIGADPDVLVNNTTYPIGTVTRTDDDVIIKLDKFDTKNTRITDDELYALPYNKENSVADQHREKLEDTTIEKALHSLCPAGNTANTPIILTTGASNGETVARKVCSPKDVAKLQRKFNDLKIPKNNRILVLCNQHLEDLMNADEKFASQYNINSTNGKISKLYGFEIYEENYNPVFQAGAKMAYGAAANGTLDQNASVAFYTGRAVKARGSVVMYHKKAETDPEGRASIIGFCLRFIAFPITAVGFGAIVSDTVA